MKFLFAQFAPNRCKTLDIRKMKFEVIKHRKKLKTTLWCQAGVMQTPWRYEGVRWKFRSVKNFPLQCIALLQAINYLKSLHTPLTKNCWLLTSQLAFEKDQFEVKGNNYFLNVKMRVRITFIILTTTPFRVNSWWRWWVKISLTLYLNYLLVRNSSLLLNRIFQFLLRLHII